MVTMDEKGTKMEQITLTKFDKFSNLTVRWLISCVLQTFSQSLLILYNPSCVCALLAWPTNKFMHNTKNYPSVTTLPAFSTYQKATLINIDQEIRNLLTILSSTLDWKHFFFATFKLLDSSFDLFVSFILSLTHCFCLVCTSIFCIFSHTLRYGPSVMSL